MTITDIQMDVMQIMIRMLKRAGFWREYSGYELNIPNPGDVSIKFYDGRRLKILPNGDAQWVPPPSATGATDA